MRRAVIMADGKRVTARDLELTDTLSALSQQTLKEARERDAAATSNDGDPSVEGQETGRKPNLDIGLLPAPEADGTVDFPQ